MFWNLQLFWRPKDTQRKTTVLPNEDAVGNWSACSNSHWWKSQHHLLLFWCSGSQENRTGCYYKINTSCFESTANILALPLFVFVERVHLCPGFNLAAGDYYPVPASYSVDIIFRPFWTSMHCGGCVLCVMFCPSDLGNARPHKNMCVYTNFLQDWREYKYLFFICRLCNYTLYRRQTQQKAHQKERRTGERRTLSEGTVLKATTLSAAYSDSQYVIENTGRNLLPTAGVDNLIPYKTSISYIFYYA